MNRTALTLGVFFFFQAEDGIRDLTVTGVQTCALPISLSNTSRIAFPVGSTLAASACSSLVNMNMIVTIDTGISASSTIDEIGDVLDRKSTRLNSSHSQISYAVFCLKKKKP